MRIVKNNWPNHLRNTYYPKVAQGDKLSMYTIALEGWRRGLELEFYIVKRKRKKEVNYSLKSREKKVNFAVSKGDGVSLEAVKICGDKWKTKKLLTEHNVPVPRGFIISNDYSDDILNDRLAGLTFPLVIKPTNTNLGKDVYTQIQDREELKRILNRLKDKHKSFIIEEYINGEEYRVYILNGKVLASTKRIPANVVGDGKSSIRELIRYKNKLRNDNPNYGNRKIKINKDLRGILKKDNLSLDSVIDKDQVLYLRNNSNISTGGEPVDITDTMPSSVSNAAIRAVDVMPGLSQAGVDIMYDEKTDKVGIIEINTRPGIGLHIFPEYGKGRDIPKEIIDYYFPETQDVSIFDKHNIVFDFENIMNSLLNGNVSRITTPVLSADKYVSKELIINGHDFNNLNVNWIKRKLNFNEIHGEISADTTKITLKIFGLPASIDTFTEELSSLSPFSKRVKGIVSSDIQFHFNVGVLVKKNIDIEKNKNKSLSKEKNKNIKESKTNNTKQRKSLLKRLKRKIPGKITKILGDNVEEESILEQGIVKSVGKDIGYPKRFKLTAAGDILLHKRLFNTAKKGGKYSFDDKLENVATLFQSSDLSIVNQESIIAGKKLGLSSFPNFNSPVEIGYKLKDMGIDIVTLANNHVLDKGKEGLFKSIENWEKIGMPYVGAYKSKIDSEQLRIFEVNGLKVCFLAYTRTLNGKKLDKEDSHLVNTYKPTRMKPIKDLLKNIKNQGLADVIIVSMHFGKEYHLMPSAEQREVAADLSDAGADVILGHHPHVIQPFEQVMNSRGLQTFTAYSLGNFYTGQHGLYRQIGAVLNLEVEKQSKEDKKVSIINPSIRLTFVDSWDKKDFKLYLLEDYIKEHSLIKTDKGDFDSKRVYEEICERLKYYNYNLTIR